MDKLKELFSKAQIKYIISVDDCHDLGDLPDVLLIKDNMAKNQENTKLFFADIKKNDFADTLISLPPEDVFDYIDTVFSELTKEELALYVRSNMNEHLEEAAAKTALLTLFEDLKSSEIIEEYIILTSRSAAQELFDKLQEKLTISQDKKVLWMIDKDLSKSGGTSESGVDLIKNFISTHKPYNIYALTSAQLAGIDNNHFRESISEHIALSDALLACVVDKHNITGRKYTELYDQISHGFRQNYSGAILKELRTIFSNASTKANDTIKRFGDDTLYKVFFESGKAEGISPIEVFQRLLLIIIRDDIIKHVSDKYDEISKLVYDYSRLCDWCGIVEKDYQDFDVIKKARISECYDLHVNTRYLPVTSGDIFRIGEKYYILLGQSCNLTIRDSGERTAQCATLARISRENTSSQNAISKYNLNYFQENQVWAIDYNDCINVDFTVLDLCSLNNNGKSVLDDNFDLTQVHYRYTNAICKRLRAVVKHNSELIQKRTKLCDGFSENIISFEDLCDGVREIFKDNSPEVKAQFTNGISYNIVRIQRISNDILDDILKKYSEYHSRKGLDHDFAKEYRAITCSVDYGIDWSAYGIDVDSALCLLLPQYTFYQTEAYKKKDELKGAILQAFREEYTATVFEDTGKKSTDQWKYDENSLTIKGTGKDIPVEIASEVYTDVLKIPKEGFCAYKIPTKKLLGLKSKQNGTYQMTNDAQMRISNGYVTFVFPNGIPHAFSDNSILEQSISFKVQLSDKIKLQITYNDVCESKFEESVAKSGSNS